MRRQVALWAAGLGLWGMATAPWFVDAFNAMVEELLAHPRIEVTHSTVPRRFTKTGKTTWDAALSARRKQPKAMREVMAGLGGFKVRWFLHEQPLARKRKPELYTLPRDVLEQVPFATGCIAFTNDVVLPPPPGLLQWEHTSDAQQLTLDGKPYPEAAFRASLRLFDQGQYDTVEWVDPPGGPAGLTLGRDAHANYGTRIVDPDTYLRLLVATRGATALRRRFFEGTWTLPPAPPPLEALLAELASA